MQEFSCIKGDTSPIMPSVSWAVDVSSRRQFVKSSFLAASFGKFFTAAALQRKSDKLDLLSAVGSGDSPLLRLCSACDAFQQQAAALWQGATRIADDDARDLGLTRIAGRQLPLLEQLCELRPTTPREHAVRARTLLLWDKDPCWTRPACLDEALAAAVMRDLARSA